MSKSHDPDAQPSNNDSRLLDGPPSKDVTTANGSMVQVERDGSVFYLSISSPQGDSMATTLNGIEAEDIAMALAPIAYYEVRVDESSRATDRAINAMLYLIREEGAEKEELLKIVEMAWGWDR